MIIMSRAWPKDTRQLTRNQRKKRKLLRSQLTLEEALLNYQKQEVVGVIGAPRWPRGMNVYVCISKALESDNLPLFIVSRNKDICRRDKARNVVFRLLGGLNFSDNHFCLSSVERKHCRKEIGKETERCVPPPSMTSRRGTFVWLATTWHKDAGSTCTGDVNTQCSETYFFCLIGTHCRPTFLNRQSMGRGTFSISVVDLVRRRFCVFFVFIYWDESSYNKITRSFSLDFVWFIN